MLGRQQLRGEGVGPPSVSAGWWAKWSSGLIQHASYVLVFFFAFYNARGESRKFYTLHRSLSVSATLWQNNPLLPQKILLPFTQSRILPAEVISEFFFF